METKFKGKPVKLAGDFVFAGQKAPFFTLTERDLSHYTLSPKPGKYIVMNIFPSIDTAVCSTTVRKFNQRAALLPNVEVLCISRDLPFAQQRFCAAEGLEHVRTLSDFHRSSTFGEDYGVMMTEGPLNGLLARAVVVVSPDGVITYSQLVPEITDEPNYDAALCSLQPLKQWN